MRKSMIRLRMEYDNVPIIDIKDVDDKKIKRAFDEFRKKVD